MPGSQARMDSRTGVVREYELDQNTWDDYWCASSLPPAAHMCEEWQNWPHTRSQSMIKK